MWDPTPWFIGGGALHSPEVARLLPYALINDTEGIVGVNDLKVQPLAVPGGSVRVAPGAAIVPNRSTGGSQQAYIGRNPTDDVVAIAPTGSGAGRTDMIVARVEDPFAAGTPWQEPADPTDAQYIFTRVISNVGAAAVASPTAARNYLRDNGFSAIPLGAVILPVSTATVTDTMIKDLRKVARPRTDRQLRTRAFVEGETEVLTSTAANGEYWPNNTAGWDVDVPEWATYAKIVVTVGSVLFPPGSSYGILWATLGADIVPTQTVRFDSPNAAGNSRFSLTIADDISVPASLRGTTQSLQVRGKIDGGTTGARPVLDWASSLSFDIEFQERAD